MSGQLQDWNRQVLETQGRDLFDRYLRIVDDQPKLREEREQLSAENNTLRFVEAVAIAVKKSKKLSAENQILRQDLQTRDKNLAEVITAKAALDSKVQTADRKIKDLEDGNRDLKEENEELSKEKEKTLQDLHKSKQEHGVLISSIKQLTDVNSSLARNKQKLGGRLDNATNEVERHRSIIRKLEEGLRTAKSETQALREISW
ncbi:MAG: hypothetical protein Q9218_003438 [Villophora microphyllina]